MWAAVEVTKFAAATMPHKQDYKLLPILIIKSHQASSLRVAVTPRVVMTNSLLLTVQPFHGFTPERMLNGFAKKSEMAEGFDVYRSR